MPHGTGESRGLPIRREPGRRGTISMELIADDWSHARERTRPGNGERFGARFSSFENRGTATALSRDIALQSKRSPPKQRLRNT